MTSHVLWARASSVVVSLAAGARWRGRGGGGRGAGAGWARVTGGRGAGATGGTWAGAWAAAGARAGPETRAKLRMISKWTLHLSTVRDKNKQSWDSVWKSEHIIRYREQADWNLAAASDLLLPLEALRRVRFFSRPRPLSPASFAAPDFSLPRCLLLSSSFLFVGEGALVGGGWRKKKSEFNMPFYCLLFETCRLVGKLTSLMQRYERMVRWQCENKYTWNNVEQTRYHMFTFGNRHAGVCNDDN